MTKPSLTLRGDSWHMRKRVPKRYARIDTRAHVWISLRTDSRSVAERKAPEVWAQMIEAWEAKLAGDTDDAEIRYDAARELAAARGYRYLEAHQVAKLPLDDLLERLAFVRNSKGKIETIEAEAMLGGARKPTVTVSKAFDLFYHDAADRITGMSSDQMRRHRAARARAVKHFIQVIGDREIGEISTRDMFDFKTWWLEKIVDEGVKRDTANKDFSYLMAMWRAVAQARDIDLKFQSRGLQFRGVEKEATRPPFSTEWLRDRLLPGLGKLNKEARAITLMMVNTGARPSELAALTGARIVLDAPIPFIKIEPEGRKVKSVYADRAIPLVGVSLEAARLCPDGFPTYNDNPGLSATVNKFMAENGLRQSPDHTMYSIRHSFESRMIRADFPERIKADLMGHRLKRERYGEVGMDQMRDWLGRIAL